MEKEAPKQPNTLLVVLGIISSVFLVGLCVYVLYRDGVFSNTIETITGNVQDNGSDNGQQENGQDTSSPTSLVYEGDTIKATLPSSEWSITEYYDGDGTDSLPDYDNGTTYTGLTALSIKKNNVEMFSIKAVSGIGFAGCSDYAIFEDNNDAYQLRMESMNDEMGDTMTVHDYTNTTYSEFEFLGKTFRRVDDLYYYDDNEGNNYFESPCVSGLLVVEGLYFKDSEGYLGEAYFYGPRDEATLDDLTLVDGILESITLVD